LNIFSKVQPRRVFAPDSHYCETRVLNKADTGTKYDELGSGRLIPPEPRKLRQNQDLLVAAVNHPQIN